MAHEIVTPRQPPMKVASTYAESFARVLSLDGPRLASLELIPSGVHRNVPKTMSSVRVVAFVNLTEDSFSCRDLGIGRPLST